MKPFSGIISSHQSGWKLSHRSNLDIELYFYPESLCQKPKLKWNLTKFNYKQSQMEISLQVDYTNSSTPTTRSSPTCGAIACGPQSSLPQIQTLLTPLPILPSLSLSQTPREETLSIWNVSSKPSWNPIFSHSIHPIMTAWIVLYPPLWLIPPQSSPPSTPELVYQHAQELTFPEDHLDLCFCRIDICYCNSHHPITPPTPLGIHLWNPQFFRAGPIEGLHYNQHPGQPT